MRVFVATPSGAIITLGVGLRDTSDDVKAKIYLYHGIPPDGQRLTFEGSCVEGGHTLMEYNINKDSMLHLDYSMQIFVETLTGKTITVDVEASDTIDNVEAKIQDKEGTP